MKLVVILRFAETSLALLKTLVRRPYNGHGFGGRQVAALAPICAQAEAVTRLNF
jgi:hypothetical protein